MREIKALYVEPEDFVDKSDTNLFNLKITAEVWSYDVIINSKGKVLKNRFAALQ
jgi:hypothetical protein